MLTKEPTAKVDNKAFWSDKQRRADTETENITADGDLLKFSLIPQTLPHPLVTLYVHYSGARRSTRPVPSQVGDIRSPIFEGKVTLPLVLLCWCWYSSRKGARRPTQSYSSPVEASEWRLVLQKL